MLVHRLTAFLGVYFSIAIFFTLRAQTDAYSFIHYTTDNGLSNDRITVLGKDRLGFTWIGTLNGLNRFDGRSFRVFWHDPTDPKSLPSNNITGIRLAPDGNLWISTNDGLCILDPQRLTIQRIVLPEQEDTLHNDCVCPVVFDREGMPWVCAEHRLYRLDPKGKQLEAYPIDAPFAGLWQTLADRKGRIWMSNEARLTCFDTHTKTVRVYGGKESPQAEGAAIMRLGEDQSGTIWVSSWFGGLFQYDPGLDQLVHAGPGARLSTGFLFDTTYTGRPFMWIGGGQYGLYTYFPDNGQTVEMPGSPLDPHTHNSSMISDIIKDRANGDVWIGTENGLEYFSPTTIRFGRALIPIEPDFSQFSLVSSAVKDQTDTSGQTYYIGVWGCGLFRWIRDKNLFTRFKQGNSPVIHNEIFSLLQDRQGRIWIGQMLGVNRYDPRTGQWRAWKGFFSEKKIANKIMCMLLDRKGNLWMGSNKQGLFRYNPVTDNIEYVHLPAETRSSSDRMFISTMVEDTLGRIWLGARDRIVRYNPATGETKVTVLSHGATELGLSLSKEGQIWASAGSELLELDLEGKVLRRFNSSNGLHCTTVIFNVIDAQGRIWCNSDHLLHCLDPKTGQFTYYGKPDGLFGNSITDGLIRMPDGEIFIGFQNAFNFFNPAQLRNNVNPPPVVITSVKVLNKEQDLLSPLTLQPGENLLAFEFAALNFSQPERNRYAYKLEGFDPDWVYTDRPTAIYTNLKGGNYRFRVKASNNDGIWNETGSSFVFSVKPPLTERWYFRFGLVLLAALLLFGFSYYRRNQRERLDAFRERLARDLHDEMGSTLSSIRFFSEFAQTQIAETKPETLPILQRISQSASALSESLQDIIWAMKSRNDELDDLSSRMTEFGLRMLEARGIRFKTRIPDEFPGRRLSPEQRRNLYLIFKEALNNAAKYGQCTEVELRFAARKNVLLLEISDNGQGFDPAEIEKGNGLHNMRERAREIGGKLDIRTGPGKGTQVRLRMEI